MSKFLDDTGLAYFWSKIKAYGDTHWGGGSGVLDFYPVGSYYETSDSNFDPNAEWGGTWLSENTYHSQIVEQGSDYVRFSNGLQICWLQTSSIMALTSAYGSFYQGTWQWDFPKAFISAPAVAIGGAKWGTSASWASLGDTPTTTSVLIRAMDIASRSMGNTKISAVAIGYWKTRDDSIIYRWHRTA